jgi:hypothetical protein
MSPTRYGRPDVTPSPRMPRIEAESSPGPLALRAQPQVRVAGLASGHSAPARFTLELLLGANHQRPAWVGFKRVDAQCSDNYRSLLCEVIDDFETCDELTVERGRTGPMDLRPCFPYQVGVAIQVDRNAVPAMRCATLTDFSVFP